MTEQPDAPKVVSVDANFWRSLTPDDRRYLMHQWGLPPFVMASYDRSTMTITMRAPETDELIDRLIEAVDGPDSS